MFLSEAAAKVGAQILTQQAPAAIPVERVCASDRMSEVLDKASSRTLLVTHLVSRHVLHAAHLMDMPGVCFAKGVRPGPELVAKAERQGTMLMVSPLEMDEIAGRLRADMADAICAPA